MKICRVIALVLVAGLVGCTKRVSVTLPPGQPLVVAQGGERMQLSPLDSRYTTLERWLASNAGGWQPSLSTEPEGGVIVQIGDQHLNFVGNSVLASTKDGVYVKKIEPADYQFLLEALRKNP